MKSLFLHGLVTGLFVVLSLACVVSILLVAPFYLWRLVRPPRPPPTLTLVARGGALRRAP